MSSNVYGLINGAVFGLVLLEVSIQIGFSLINKQKLKRFFPLEGAVIRSAYFKFLVFTFLWVVLRFIMSFHGVNSNAQLSMMLLDLLYPCIVSSFLILSRHYIVVLGALLVRL